MFRRARHMHTVRPARTHVRTHALELTASVGSPHWMWEGRGVGTGGRRRDEIIWNPQKSWTSREQVADSTSQPPSEHLCTCAQGRLANQRRSQRGLRGKTQISQQSQQLSFHISRKPFSGLFQTARLHLTDTKKNQIVFCLFAISWLNSHIAVPDVCQRKLSCCNIQVGPGQTSTGWWLH